MTWLLHILHRMLHHLPHQLLHQARWLKQDLACWLLPGRRGSVDRWAAGVAPPIGTGAAPIWIVASGGVSALYVGVAYQAAIQNRFPDASCVMFVSDAQLSQARESQLAESDVVLAIPEFCCWEVRRRLAGLRPACVLKVGFGFNLSLLNMPRYWGTPITWVAAELYEPRKKRFPQQLLRRWHLERTFEMIYADSEITRNNLLACGAPAERIRIGGVAKYDATDPLPSQVETAEALLQRVPLPNLGGQVLLAASLAVGEEQILLDVYTGLKPRFPNLFLIMAPISPRRSQQTISQIAHDKRLRIVLRSQLDSGYRRPPEPPDVLVLDSLGELRGFYSHADVVFVGRSLVPCGGSSIVEPAAAGRAVVAGPHHECVDVADELIAAGAMVQVHDALGLQDAVAELLDDPPRREMYGRRALDVVRQRKGVINRTLDSVQSETSCFASFTTPRAHAVEAGREDREHCQPT